MAQTTLMKMPAGIADGDIVYIEDGEVKRLPKGANGEYLQLASGLPVWGAGGGGAESDPNAILKATLDAKGDIIVASGDNVPARLAVGANGKVLKANSAAATGLEWADDAGGGTGRGFISGLYYTGDIVGQDSTQAPTNNAVTAVPFSVGRATTFNQMALEVTVAAGAGGVARMGLYVDAGGPGALLFEATGTVDTTTTGVKTFTINQLVPVGEYWLAVLPQVAAPTLRAVGPMPNGRVGLAAATSAWAGGAVSSPASHSGATAMPTPFGTITPATNQGPPKLFMRAA